MVGTFIILAITISMLFTYANSLRMTRSKSLKAQEELIENFNKTDNEAKEIGASENMAITTTKIVGAFIVLYYILFYIISAVVIDSLWATVIAGLGSVFSVKSYFTAMDFVNTRKIKPFSYWGKIPTAFFLLYIIYFFVTYLKSRFDNMEILYLCSGMIIGTAVILLFKKLRNKK